jgi:hypothetical protein
MLVVGAAWLCSGLCLGGGTLAQNAPGAPNSVEPTTASPAPGDDVWQGLVMRSGLEPPVGRPVAVGVEGLTVETGEGVAARRFLVGLDRIAQPPTLLASSFERVRGVSERAWRARIRLERGDLIAAEPLLEELAKEIGSARGATPELVHRGLLACRLARGVHTGALESYIRWRLAAEGLGEDSTSSAGLDAAIDSSTRLATQLPPMWIDGPATQAFARSATHVEDGTTGAAAALARLYEAAAKVASGEALTEAWDPLAPGVGVGSAAVGDEGVSLVRDIVAARLGDDATRSKARNDLLRRTAASIPAWQHAWILTGAGQSLVRESDRELRLRGVAMLLEVPARFEDACPYLTGLAMAEAAIALGDMGDVASALRVRSDLAGRWPGHAALDLARLRGLTERGTSAAAQPAQLPEPPTASPAEDGAAPNDNADGNNSLIQAPEVDPSP